MAADLKDDLTRHLYGQLPEDAGFAQWAAIPYHWVMNQEWFDTICETFLDVRTPGESVCLLGFPVAVEADGGVPHVVRGIPRQRATL